MAKVKYKRILLKLSGEALLPPDSKYGISTSVADKIAAEIKQVVKLGVQLGVVIGAGNIFRGEAAADEGMDRVIADNMGMLATVINSLALQDGLFRANVPSRVLTSFPMHQVGTPFSQRDALRYLGRGDVVIFGGGTGNPFFSTDTAASLRALEVHAEIIFKGTKVDGIYDKDPVKHKNAKKFQNLSYLDVLNQKLSVMDLTAISMCMNANIPITVFDMFSKGNFLKAVSGEKIGTLVHA
ncbi:MAG: UMP kinase [Deltaproteobacteria bacterium CG_4_10_14_0_2_um_filter_43_8]|nr:MAG: UMP kinase [Deltaproteobacteria bacterium CG11_big_fil_rev_8_21_14_0_20_42_23]PJA18736.1 MAG: UMP kinase [Deltaproteobacteria bacterium CG_4_10_14_0_2_um_filter_43_8]PJC64402.1 MAG: UMP kinase [Deltaproteobacteria bacterium CG_4_9_14_0_2_um_filter_42_21]